MEIFLLIELLLLMWLGVVHQIRLDRLTRKLAQLEHPHDQEHASLRKESK